MWSRYLIASCLAVATANAAQDQKFISSKEPEAVEKRHPNIVFILTDDQDVHLQSLDYMPLVRKHLIEQGTYFSNHYCTTAVCCPSRVTLWTGKAAHNTNVTDVNPPYGTVHLHEFGVRASETNLSNQADIQSSFLKGSMRTIYQSGCNKPVTTLTTPGNSSMYTQ